MIGTSPLVAGRGIGFGGGDIHTTTPTRSSGLVDFQSRVREPIRENPSLVLPVKVPDDLSPDEFATTGYPDIFRDLLCDEFCIVVKDPAVGAGSAQVQHAPIDARYHTEACVELAWEQARGGFSKGRQEGYKDGLIQAAMELGFDALPFQISQEAGRT